MRKVILSIISVFLVALTYATPSFACGGCPGENPQPMFADWAFVVGLIATIIGAVVISIVFVIKVWKGLRRKD